MAFRGICLGVLGSALLLVVATTGVAQDSKAPSAASGDKPAAPAPPYAAILKDAKTVTGMLTLHQRGNSLFVELTPGDYSSEYMMMIAISRGIAQGQLLGGMTWNMGDEWVWQFRKIDENVHVIRKNVRFKADANSPESRAVHAAYTDSVLFSLPIMAKGPKGGDLVDLTPIFMSDLPQIGMVLPGFNFSSQKSSWAAVKAFTDNVELEVAATYASGGMAEIDTVPDSRGVTINVHYSISQDSANRLSAATGRRSRRLLPDGGQGFFEQDRPATSSSATSTAGICKRPILRPSSRRRKADRSFTSKRPCRSSSASRSTTAFMNGTRRSRRRASSTRSRSTSSSRTTTKTRRTCATTSSAGSPATPALPWAPAA